MNRRGFLAAGLASLGAACGLQQAKPGAESSRVALSDVKRLGVLRVDPIAGRCRYVVDLGTRQVGQPILFARRGERFDALIENALPQPTTVHFHGLTLSQAQDGAGFDPIPPGERKRVRFEVQNRSGLYWFHPHPHGFTAEQVYAGLAGLLVVTDDDDQTLDAALALAPANRLALACRSSTRAMHAACSSVFRIGMKPKKKSFSRSTCSGRTAACSQHRASSIASSSTGASGSTSRSTSAAGARCRRSA